MDKPTIFELLDQRETSIKGEMASLREELDQVRQMRSIAKGHRKTVATRKPRTRSAGKMTMGDYVKGVLANRPDGATSAELVTLIKEQFGVDVKSKSLSPRLSAMGKENILIREGRMWKLAPGQEPEAVTESVGNGVVTDESTPEVEEKESSKAAAKTITKTTKTVKAKAPTGDATAGLV